MVDVVEHLANFVMDNIIPVMMDQYTSPITEDYKVGATAINALNAASSNVHKVAFYGVEDEPVLWRVQSSLSVQKPNDFDYFQANSDEGILTIANDNEDSMYAKYLEWKQVVDDWNILDAINIFDGLNKNEAKQIRDGYYQGYSWWNNANSRYKIAIGALVMESLTETICECIDYFEGNGNWNDGTFPGPCSDYPNNQPCSDCVQCFSTPYTTYYQVNKESDGVVLAESAANFPGATHVYKLQATKSVALPNTTAC